MNDVVEHTLLELCWGEAYEHAELDDHELAALIRSQTDGRVRVIGHQDDLDD